jgi:hypothetical protein
MSYLRNEKGNAAIFLLWLLGIFTIVFLISINIVKVYIVKEHASLSVDQAALAGTAAIIERTKKAVEDFDEKETLDPLYIADRASQRAASLGKSVGQLIEEKKNEYLNSGMDEADAYIKAVNKILPNHIHAHPFLKKEMRSNLGLSSSDAKYIYSPAVLDVIANNQGRTEDTEPVLSTSEWRIEVKSTVRFESITDNKFISKFISDIPQKGYGPKLSYLEAVYTGTIVLPTP